MSSNTAVVKRSLFITFSERYIGVVMQFVSIMLLARLLTPTEIGIYTVGSAVIGMAHMVRDFGISQFLIQEKELTKEKVSAALGLTILIAWTLGVLVFLAAAHIARYYEEAIIEDVIHVVGLNFFIIPIGAMAPSLLKRSMSFGTLLIINLSTTFTNSTLVVILAFLDCGVMSIAWASLASTCVAAAMGQYFLPSKFRVLPSLQKSKKILRFGSFFLGSNLANQLGISISDMIIGRALGFAPLGLFSRAGGYLKIYTSLVSSAINPVAHAHFAKINRESGKIADSYLHALDLLTLVSWPILSYMALMSTQLVFVLYGDQWLGSAPLATILCVAFSLVVVSMINDQVMIATGRVRAIFVIAFLSNVVKIAIIATLVKRGLLAVTFGVAAAMLFQFLVTTLVVTRTMNISFRSVVKIIMRNLLGVSITMLVPCYYFINSQLSEITFTGSLLQLGLAAAYSIGVFVALLFIFDHSIKYELVNTIFLIRRKIRGA